MATALMPSERICLKRTRKQLIDLLDVTTILPQLCAENFFTVDEETAILSDPRRRKRTTHFLDALEKKSSETFKAFSNVLEEQNPHLYLIMSEWDKDDNTFDTGRAGRSGDEWAVLNKRRRYVLSQIDGANVVPHIPGEVLSAHQRQTILNDPNRDRRTEVLLDMLESCPDGYGAFIEAIGEIYPHVYLELNGGGDDDDW